MYYGSVAGRAGSGVGGILATFRMECIGCPKNDRDDRLNKCPICFKWVCDGCGVHTFGRIFCSKKCSDQFFFGDDDE